MKNLSKRVDQVKGLDAIPQLSQIKAGNISLFAKFTQQEARNYRFVLTLILHAYNSFKGLGDAKPAPRRNGDDQEIADGSRES